MPKQKQLPPDWKPSKPLQGVIVSDGAGSVRSLSAAFLASFERDWLAHGEEIWPVLREKHPQAYFKGLVQLSRVIRWEIGKPGEFEKPRTPEEILDQLEQRVGPQGRRMFERFLKQVGALELQAVEQDDG